MQICGNVRIEKTIVIAQRLGTHQTNRHKRNRSFSRSSQSDQHRTRFIRQYSIQYERYFFMFEYEYLKKYIYLFLFPGEKWREMRAALSPAFTSSKIKNMFTFMNECAEQVTDFISKENEIMGISIDRTL